MATWPGSLEIDWDADDKVCTEEKGDRLQERDEYVRDKIVHFTQGHNHDETGTRGVELCKAQAEFRGAIIHWVEKLDIAGGGTSLTFYLTDTQTSGGDGVFTQVPVIIVMRGTPALGTVVGIGHDTAAAYHYDFSFSWNSGSSRWEVVVVNNDPSTQYNFWVIAEGV